MKTLKIAKNLSLPEDTITSTMIVYGGKGMGKTNLLSVMCEELAKKRLKFSVMDPMGVCWGLQHGADKSSKGIDVLILGGVHGDIPIEPTAGAIVADLVVDETVSTVIDISRHANGKMWSKGERIRFVADYCTRLYERQGENRAPLLQFFDEAAGFAPQMIPHGAIDIARCSGAIMSLCEEGRNIGVGLGFFTLRSARLNKSVAELADCMISFRTVGPNSIKAILEWLGEHVDKSRWNDLLAKIRSLPIGQALVVSPGWLQYEGIAQIRPRETFDSSATPKPGKSLRAPGKATKPDLKKYRERMKATIEKAQAEDPRALRAQLAQSQARIVKLEGILAEANTRAERIDKKLDLMQTKPASAAKVEIKEVPVVTDKQFAQLQKAADKVADILKRAIEGSETIKQAVDRLQAISSEISTTARMKSIIKNELSLIRQGFQAPLTSKPSSLSHVPAKTPKTSSQESPEGLSDYALLLINTMARRHPMQVTRGQLAVLSGRSIRSSAFSAAVAEILRAGVVRQSGTLFSLTDAGMLVSGGINSAPATPQEKQETWRRALPDYQRALFEVLLAAYPQAIAREELAERAGKSITSSAFSGAIASLRKNGLADTADSGLKASDTLFD